MATCPECDTEIEVDEFDVDRGDLFDCPECGTDLEVTGLSPLELDVVSQDEEVEFEGEVDANEDKDEEDKDEEDEEWSK